MYLDFYSIVHICYREYFRSPRVRPIYIDDHWALTNIDSGLMWQLSITFERFYGKYGVKE